MEKNRVDQIIFSFFYSRMLSPQIEEFRKVLCELKLGVGLGALNLHLLSQADLVLWAQVLKEQARLSEQILKAHEKKIHFTFPGEWDYPSSMYNMVDIPFFLTYFGHPVWLQQLCLAVVGSREPSDLSERWCEEELPGVLKDLNIFFVSGGARGVDQVAHRICLRNNVSTVAFLPSGLLEIYPSEFSHWADDIVANGGALVSEFSPQVKMKKYFFQRRNRLIAGLAIGTLVVEARDKSGTLITARQTLEQGKPLFVLPSHPYDKGNHGGLNLLCDGATPIRDAKDLTICLGSEMRYFNFEKADLVNASIAHH